MNNISVFGVDISKQVFHVIGLDDHNNIVVKRKLKRGQVLSWFVHKIPAQLVWRPVPVRTIGAEN